MPENLKPRIDYAGKYVLVVDDFSQHLNFMSKALRSIGFTRIAVAQNPREATALCEETSFDLILCDYNMGEGKNGQQLLHELRYFKTVRHDCIFVMITAETSREVVLGALESEPEGYIAKPFNQAVLRRKIDRLLDKQMCLKDINLAIDHHDYEKAIDLCLDIGEKQPRHQAWCQKTSAELHLKLGQYQQAKRVYKSVLSKRILDWALLGLARTHIYLKEYNEAISELQQVLVLNNNCVPAYDLLAECYQYLEDTETVQEHLTHAAKLSPLSVERQNTLGEVCSTNGDHEAAAKAFRQALKSSKFSIQEEPDRYFKLAGAITDSMIGDLSRYDATKVMEVQKLVSEMDERFTPEKETSTRKDLINVRLFLNQQKPSMALDLMASLDPELLADPEILSTAALFEYAQTLLKLGEQDKAHSILVAALERKDLTLPQRNHANQLIAVFEAEELAGRARELNDDAAKFYEQEDLEESIKLFSEAVKLSPRSVVLNLNLTQALVRVMEDGRITAAYSERGKACLDCIGPLDESSRHFARYNNLVERINQLESSSPHAN
jgi:tetratricopeptide (TPR) repeat protein